MSLLLLLQGKLKQLQFLISLGLRLKTHPVWMSHAKRPNPRTEKRGKLHSKVSQGFFLQSGENREQASEELQQTVTLKFSLIN